MHTCALQTVFPYGAQVKAIVKAIADLRATVSGAADDEGLFKGSDNSDYVLAPTDENAVAFSRTTAQVSCYYIFATS